MIYFLIRHKPFSYLWEEVGGLRFYFNLCLAKKDAYCFNNSYFLLYILFFQFWEKKGLSTQKRKTIMSEQASSQPPNRKIYGSLDNFPVEMIYKFAYMNMQFGFS